MKYTRINSAFILGSTSEIAKAICIELAKQGCKKFVLIARNQSKNNIFAQELIEKFNVEVTTKELDLLINLQLIIAIYIFWRLVILVVIKKI